MDKIRILIRTYLTLLFVGCLITTSFSCGKKEQSSKKDDSGTVEDSTSQSSSEKKRETQNLIVVTMDGVRWRDVFKGVDSSLVFAKQAGHPKYIKGDFSLFKENFWGDNEKERRKKFMPFLWEEVAEKGQIHGNRDLGSKVDVKNPYWLSYPGYNEIWTGYPDPDVKDNNYGLNDNYNVLEFINGQEGFEGDKVIIYDKFITFLDNILNQNRSGLEMRGRDYTSNHLNDPAMEEVLEHYQSLSLFEINESNAKQDVWTVAGAKAYLKSGHKPRVLYIATNNMDGYAHSGAYDSYIGDIHNVDVMIGDLWDYIQKDPFYKDKTTLFITCDHGRGIGDDWKSHGSTHPHSGEIWFAIIGPDTAPKGEINKQEQLYQNQFAKTFARFLGLDYHSANPIGQYIPQIMNF